MELRLLHEYPVSLRDEWDQLLEETATHVPFMRYEYQRLWWQTRGGGEWPDAQLVLVTAYRDGRLFGAAPLFFTPNWKGRPALLLSGSIEISDYLDLLVRPADLPVFLEALLPFLAQQAGVPGWQALDLYNILQESPTLPALQQAAQALGWQYSQEKLQHSPYIPLPGDWETYLASIDKKQRHEIRRKLRRAEGVEAPVSWYLSGDGQDLDAEIDDFFSLMRQDADKAEFLTEAMEKQMRLTAHFAAENGLLNLAFLKVGEQKAAAYLNFDYLNRIWVYNSGINWKDYAAYSPGWVLLGYLLQWANENGREAFDFMRGDEQYKYRFGAVDRFVMRAVVERGE